MFTFTAPNTKCNITVGYISSERGFIDDVGLYEANQYAKLNPGTQFIFRNRDFVKYLNINEVNKLSPNSLLPQKRSSAGSCSGIVGLNLEGDSSKSIDDALGLGENGIPITGGTTQKGATDLEDKTRVNFYGGGGVGVQAAPIIGIDGSILAVQVIHGGYGYKYPPIVDIHDDTGRGAGVVARSIIKTKTSDEAFLIEEYDQEEDYEEYVLDKCVPELEDIGYGQRWDPEGKNLGKWNPSTYFNKLKNPIDYDIQRYQKFLIGLAQGTIIENNRIKGWWTTKQKPPLRVTSADKVTRQIYDAFHWAWGSVPATNDPIANLYIKLFGRDPDPRGLQYWKDIQASGKSLAQVEEGMKTFPEWEEVCFGKCKPVMSVKTVQGNQYFEYDKKNFMNKYAISPTPQSNVPASDNAGKLYSLEWEEEFPFDGEYIFNVQADNEAHLFLDNEIVGDKIVLGAGGAAGATLSPPQKIKKYVKAGMRKITLDLMNLPVMEMKKIQKDVVATSDEVTFTVTTASLYANGFEIPDLGISIGKEYGNGKDIRETITKKVEYGRVYPVKFTSSNQRVVEGGNGDGTVIRYEDLNPSNKTIRVAKNNTCIELKDGRGNDANVKFTITSGDAKFSDDGRRIIGKGKVGLNLWYDDNPRYSGEAVRSIAIGKTKWVKERKHKGGESKTITLDGGNTTAGGNNSSRIKLRNKGEKVIEMEDIPGTDAGGGGVGVYWDDLICSVNNGKLFGISGNTCSFMVNPPVNSTGKSSESKKAKRAHVFNTIDWITKADRKLWKINPSPGKDSNFFNQLGILPFDPTEVAKVSKKRTRNVEVAPTGVPPSVKFEIGNDGITYLKVIGNGRVKVGLQLNVNDNPRRAGLAVREVKIQADDGEIVMKREWVTRATDRGMGIFSAGKRYEVKILGGVGRTPIPTTAGDQIGLLDSHGVDWNADIKINSITPLSITKQIEESVLGYPDYPNASTDDYAGFHEITWNSIVFPEDGNYSITTAVDDNVVLTFTGNSPQANKKDVVIDKQGFRIRGDWRTGTGKSVEVKYFKSGTYTLKAILEQLPGAPIAKGNPMALAVEVKAAFISNEIEVVSVKSWNQNPMGVAMTIDAPLAPPPKEPPQLQEGRCPKNPIWTTRSPGDKTWYPVKVDSWSKFMNRYSLSPIPPLGLKGTDGAGTVYRNSWKVELPYKGFYGVKGTVDNFGKLFIDGVEVLGPDAEKNFDNYDNAAPKSKKIFLEKKTIDITVEVENEKSFIWQTIDEKVFSTADWASKQTNTSITIEGVKNVDVTFKVSSASLYANNIDMKGVFSVGKSYGGPNFNETYDRNIEVGKVYDVVFTSNNQAQKSNRIPVVYKNLNPRNNPIKVTRNNKRIELVDGTRNNVNASITIDKTDGGEVTFTADGKGLKVTGGTAANRVKTTITLTWSDHRRNGYALDSFSVADKTWTRTNIQHGSETKDVYIYPDNATYNQNNNSNIRLRNKGKGVVQMEDWTDNDWVDIMASATDGEFYNMVGNTCKFRIPSKDKTTIEYGKGLTGGSTKDGVSYSGPPISTYGNGKLGALITPTFTSDEEYIAEFNGKTWTMTWSGVNFKETGTYDIQAEVDDSLVVKVDGVNVLRAEGKTNVNKGQFNVTEGKRTVEIVLTYIDLGKSYYGGNPTVAGVKITKKAQVAKLDPTTGTAQGKPWTVNPVGVSAILIPPPCPKKIDGVGIVTAVIITDPGNGFDPPIRQVDPDTPSGPPVIIEVDKIIPDDTGINYGPDDKVCIVNTETGEEICFLPPKGPFGEIPEFDPRKTPRVPGGPPDPTDPTLPPPPTLPGVTINAIPPVILKGSCTELVYTSKVNTKLTIDQGVGNVPVKPRGVMKVCPTETTTYCITGDVGGTACAVVTVIDDPDDPLLIAEGDPGEPAPNGYRRFPQIVVRGRGTGIGYKGIPLMKSVLDPIGVDPNRLIQVTDLPGLKQTGYYNGKPYYGAVFYENGTRYAGYYDTPGQKVQIYDSLKESIDARITTPPSAIQRQGTDINSNNPRLNIPGTPDNLT